MRRRAESVEQTRRRIVDAAVLLHGRRGPSATSLAAIAEEAGVTRATLYRHFAGEPELFAACSAAWLEQHPSPEPAHWQDVVNPDARLGLALGECFDFYRGGQDMLRGVIRDLSGLPADIQGWWQQQADDIAAVLVPPYRARGRRRERISAAVGHVTAFGTWDSLCAQQGLPEPDAIRALVALVREVADGT